METEQVQRSWSRRIALILYIGTAGAYIICAMMGAAHWPQYLIPAIVMCSYYVALVSFVLVVSIRCDRWTYSFNDDVDNQVGLLCMWALWFPLFPASFACVSLLIQSGSIVPYVVLLIIPFSAATISIIVSAWACCGVPRKVPEPEKMKCYGGLE